MSKSITVLIPAYNEEKNLNQAVEEINKVVKSIFSDYEILIFDDYSQDKTGEIADALAKKNPRIKAIHNKRNWGVGYIYRKGIEFAQKRYVMLLPGDGGIVGDSVKNILQHAGEVDIIMSYSKNKKARPLIRRIISAGFTTLLNLLFGLHLKYYNGMVLYETELVRRAKMTTNSFAFQAEILIQLIKRGHSYKEIPMYIQEKERTKTNMLRVKNLIGVFRTVMTLFLKYTLKIS